MSLATFIEPWSNHIRVLFHSSFYLGCRDPQRVGYWAPSQFYSFPGSLLLVSSLSNKSLVTNGQNGLGQCKRHAKQIISPIIIPKLSLSAISKGMHWIIEHLENHRILNLSESLMLLPNLKVSLLWMSSDDKDFLMSEIKLNSTVFT